MISSPKFIAEYPRRLLSLFNLPTVSQVDIGGQIFTLSVLMRFPVIIHPSQAYLRIGVRNEFLIANLAELNKNGFDGNKDPIREHNVQKIGRNFQNRTLGEETIQSIRDKSVKYDESHEASLLTEPIVDGPSSKRTGGVYWRADLLGYLFMTTIGCGALTGYAGSYLEALLRELSIDRGLTASYSIYNKDITASQEIYRAYVSSKQLATDFKFVTGTDFPDVKRSSVCILELGKPRIKKAKVDGGSEQEVLTIVESSSSTSAPASVASLKSELEEGPKLDPKQVVSAADVGQPSGRSLARSIMIGLNLPRIAIKPHKTYGDFTLSMLCGSVVMIHPNNLYLKFFVSPKIYEEFIVQCRAAELDESEPYIEFMTTQASNTTSSNRIWWRDTLGDSIQAKLNELFQGFPCDKGQALMKMKGGSGSSWINGSYWRADLLPHLLATATGSHIPRYRESREEKFLLEQMAIEPLSKILSPTYHTTGTASRGRGRADKHRAEFAVTVAKAVTAIASASAAATTNPLGDSLLPSASVAVIPSVVAVVRASQLTSQKGRFKDLYLDEKSVVIPPIPTHTDLKDANLSMLREALICTIKLATKKQQDGITGQEPIIAELRTQNATLAAVSERERDLAERANRRAENLDKELKRILIERSQRSRPQEIGVAGEDNAELLINEAGKMFGFLARTAAAVMKCGDFIHGALIPGFIAYEVKNGETTIGTTSGIAKTERDILETETALSKPCFGAIILSLRSNIANCPQDATVDFMSSNGHTLFVCVSNVRQQVINGGWRSDLEVVADAIRRVERHITTLLRCTFFASIHGNEVLDVVGVKLQQILGIPIGSITSESIISILQSHSESIDNFMKAVMKPTIEAETISRPRRPMKRLGGLKKRDGSQASRVSTNSQRLRVRLQLEKQVETQTITEDGDEQESDGEITAEPLVPASGRLTVPRIVVDPATMVDVLEVTNTITGNVSRSALTKSGVIPLGYSSDLLAITIPWHGIFHNTETFGPVLRQLISSVMKLCEIDPKSKVKRTELIARLHSESEAEIRSDTIRDSLTAILNEKHRGRHKIEGIRFISP